MAAFWMLNNDKRKETQESEHTQWQYPILLELARQKLRSESLYKHIGRPSHPEMVEP